MLLVCVLLPAINGRGDVMNGMQKGQINNLPHTVCRALFGIGAGELPVPQEQQRHPQ